MKKLYTVLLTAVLALVCSFSAGAQDMTMTLNVDREGAVAYKNGYGGEWVTLNAGDNEIALTSYYGYYYLYVRPTDGFSLNEIAAPEGASYNGLNVSDPTGDNTYYPYDNWAGRVYNITTIDLNATRTASMNVSIVDSPSSVSFRRNGGSTTTFAELENVVKFNPETEVPITFFADRLPFYSFTHNGEPVQPNGTTYSITPANGDNVAIQVNYPDQDVDVTISTPEGMDAVVKSFGKQNGYSYDNIDFKVNAPFTVKAGSYYKITLNTDDYTINGVRKDGELISGTYSVDFFVAQEPVSIAIDAVERQDLQFTLRTERAGEAEYSVNSYSYITLLEGDNTVIPTESWWGDGSYNSVYVKAANNYRLTRVYDVATEEEFTVPTDPTYSLTLSPNTSWMGRVIAVETQSLDETRSASVTIKVTDDPSAVNRAQRANSDIALGAAGETITVKFDPATESQFTFEGKSIPLREVLLNGVPQETISSSSYTHRLTVADGDEIVITAAYDDIEVPVTIFVDEAAKNVVKNVQLYTAWPYSDIEWTPNEPFFVKAGNRIAIDVDTNAANLKGVKIDGEDVEVFSSFNFFVKDQAVDVEFDAAPYATLKFTLNVTDPSHVTVYPGTSSYNATPYTLTGTTNELEVSEKIGMILIQPTSGNVLKSVTDENGAEVKKYGWVDNAYYITDGMTVNVETEAIVYDGTLMFWLDDINGLDTGSYTTSYWMTETDRERHNITTDGYQEIAFSTAVNDTHNFMFYLLNGQGYFYLNGELKAQKSTYGSSMWYDFKPADGDVVRVYASGAEPELHNISFEVVGDQAAAAENMTVTTDHITARPEWKDGLSVLAATHVALALPAEVEGASVQLDGEPLAADENGNYSFTTAAHHKVTVTTPSGIINLGADKAAGEGAVYNLMGVKVLDNATASDLKKLPAGIYIVNGEKKVVR